MGWSVASGRGILCPVNRRGSFFLAVTLTACQAPEQQTLSENDGTDDAEDAGHSDEDDDSPADPSTRGDAGDGSNPLDDDPGDDDDAPVEEPGSPGPDDDPDAPDGPSAAGGTPGTPGITGGNGGEAPATGGTTGSGGGVAQGGVATGAGGSASGGAGSEFACAPNAERCNGDTPEVCDAEGVWRSLLACEAPLRCVAGTCQEPLVNECPLFSTLQRFSGEQVVDGDGAEFVDVEPVVYELRSAPVVSASYAASLPTVVSARLAWSEGAFVAHVHVADPAIFTYEGGVLEYFWQGDNVQFFIAPTDVLTGQYSGTEDGGATHLVVVPPSETQPAVAIEVYEPCYACVDASLSAVSYAARAVADGYEIELSWPWASPLGMFSPGDRVALNLVVGAQDDAGAGLQLEGLIANNPVAGETPCGGATHPGCDDRTWCYSVLE